MEIFNSEILVNENFQPREFSQENSKPRDFPWEISHASGEVVLDHPVKRQNAPAGRALWRKVRR
jgi:hypothetical protein